MLKSMPSGTNYFDLQANAFAKRELELDVQPDSAVLACTSMYMNNP